MSEEEMVEDRIHIVSRPLGTASMRKKRKLRRDYVIKVVHNGFDEIRKSRIKLIGSEEWMDREEMRSIRLYFSQFVFDYDNIDARDTVARDGTRYRFIKVLNY